MCVHSKLKKKKKLIFTSITYTDRLLHHLHNARKSVCTRIIPGLQGRACFIYNTIVLITIYIYIKLPCGWIAEACKCEKKKSSKHLLENIRIISVVPRHTWARLMPYAPSYEAHDITIAGRTCANEF